MKFITALAICYIEVVAKGLRLKEISGKTDLETVMSKTGAKLPRPEGDIPGF